MHNQAQQRGLRRRVPRTGTARRQTRRRYGFLGRARATALCVLLALGQTLGIITSCLSPSVAAAAEPGQTVEIESFGDNRHQVAGTGENAFCVEPGRRPGVGTRTVVDLLGQTSRSPEKYWDQDSVTTVALVVDYCMNHSGLERGEAYDFCQQTIWHYVRNGDLYMGEVDAGLSEAMGAYVEANRADHIGKGYLYYADDGQSTASLRVEEMFGGLELRKSSSDTSASGANKLYDLGGAVYGVFSDRSCSGTPTTSLETNSAGSASASGLKRGSYWVRELSPSPGYALDETVYPVEVPAGSVATLAVGETPQTCDIEVAVRKVDAETGEPAPTGEAILAGAEFRLDYYAGRYDKENLPEAPTASYTIMTGDDGVGRLNKTLSLGTVAVKETKAPQGYLPDPSTHIVHIDAHGTKAKVETYAVPQVKEQVIRGNVAFIKADEDTQRRLAGVAFLITAQDGESHVVVTDENGIFDSSALDPTTNTNANDGALEDGGDIDESKLDPTSGVWFGSGSIDPSRGSLPYGTYRIQELRCKANEGHRLIEADLTVTRDGRTYALGTFDNKAVHIATALVYGDSCKTCPADDEVELSDIVSYEGLEPGHGYTIAGELHAMADDGTDRGIVAKATTAFAPALGTGSKAVGFTVDTASLAGMRLVAFERVYDGDDLLAEHADPSDEGQSVRVPAIGTTLAKETNHEADASAGTVRITDAVTYRGLEPQKTYTIVGSLHLKDEDGNDAGIALDDEGNEILAETEFTAEGANGTAEVVFEFTGSGLSGKQAVAFEELWHEGRCFTVHADIEDDDQAVSFPSLKTTAMSAATESKLLPASSGQSVTDTVEMRGLTAGAEYELRAELHLVGDGGGDEGVLSQARKTFTADGTESSQAVELEVDASSLGSRTLVVFEELWRGGTRVGSHADLGDEGQSVHVPQIATSLAGADGQKTVEVREGDEAAHVELIDTVSYQGLIPGETYELEGTLYTVKNGEAVDAVKDESGTAVAARSSFVADREDGEADVVFAFDAKALGGSSSVAFEQLNWKGIRIASHNDPACEPQTVAFATPEKPQTTTPDKPAAQRSKTPKTGDVALPVFACSVLGGLLAFCGWAIVRVGSEGDRDE